MKVKIKKLNGTVEYLTVGKEYEAVPDGEGYYIRADNGDEAFIILNNCCHLNGGSWEIIQENKMNLEEAIRAMLDGKKVRVIDYDGYAYYNKEYAKPFRWVFPGEAEEEFKNVWKHNEWEIVPELKKRPMTRNEVLGFLANTSGVVVRHEMDIEWKLFYFTFDCEIDTYEYAYVDEKGNIGEPMKFEVEE